MLNLVVSDNHGGLGLCWSPQYRVLRLIPRWLSHAIKTQFKALEVSGRNNPTEVFLAFRWFFMVSIIDPFCEWKPLIRSLKTQFKAPEAPNSRLKDKITQREGGISCLSLVLYGRRASIIDPLCEWNSCIRPYRQSIRQLAYQHCD